MIGVRKGFQFVYGQRKLPEPEQLARYGVQWAPYRTTVACYLWRAAGFLNGMAGEGVGGGVFTP